MPTVKVGGHTIAYLVAGEGEPVLLQHGLFARGEWWLHHGWADALGAGWSLVMVDSLGHGDSDAPLDPEPYRLESRVEDLVAVLDDVGAPRVHAVGYSMGGWIVNGLAAYTPERLRTLSVGGWDLRQGVETAKQRTVAAGFEFTFDVAVAFARSFPDLAGDIEHADLDALRLCWDAFQHPPDARPAIEAAGVPVLLFCGELDPYHSAMQQDGNTMANARFVGVPGADHLQVFAQPGALAGELRALFEGA